MKIVKSAMPGVYAPPAVALPKTTAMFGIPARDISACRRKPAPPGTNVSPCVGRSAPPDSTRLMNGSRFSCATSIARMTLRSVYGFIDPPFTVASLTVTTHSTPSTTPMPVMVLAPTVNCVS